MIFIKFSMNFYFNCIYNGLNNFTLLMITSKTFLFILNKY